MMSWLIAIIIFVVAMTIAVALEKGRDKLRERAEEDRRRRLGEPLVRDQPE